MKRVARLVRANIPFIFTGSKVEPGFPSIQDAVDQAVNLYGDKVDPDVVAMRLEASQDQVEAIMDRLGLDDRFFLVRAGAKSFLLPDRLNKRIPLG